MLPDKDVKCHRTGFTQSCRQLVAEGSCTRWRSLPINDPATGENKLVYDCIDNHSHDLNWCILRAIDQNSASLDKVATEVQAHRNESVTMAAIAVDRSQKAIRDLVIQNEPAPKALPNANHDS